MSSAQKCAELLHFDLCGPMKEKSTGGASYMCLFTDDFSGMLFPYFLRKKSDAIDAIKSVVAKISGQGHTVMKMRSDNAKELVSAEVESFFKEKSIVHELSSPYCPEQNGRTERQNRTIIEMARTMRIEASLPLPLWAELCNTSAIIRNRLPLERLDGKSPYEVWTNEKRSLSHYRIGSKAFAHVPSQFRTKFDDKAEEMILIGYEPESKAFRIWSPNANKIRVVRTARFIEPQQNCSNFIDDDAGHSCQFTEGDVRNVLNSVDTVSRVQDAQRSVNPPHQAVSEEMHVGRAVDSDDENEMPVLEPFADPTIQNRPISTVHDGAIATRTRSRARLNLTTTVPCLSTASFDLPTDYQEAMDSPHAKDWLKAMNEELE